MAIRLHNGLIYIPSEFVDNEDITTGEVTKGTWRKDPPTESWYSISVTKAKNPTQEAQAIREEFNEYFFNEQSLPWQKRWARIDV